MDAMSSYFQDTDRRMSSSSSSSNWSESTLGESVAALPQDAKDAEQQDTPQFQQPLFCNRYLPYYEALNEEAEGLLEDIKRNLSRAIQLQELWPSALYWTNRLRSYIKMYGYQFTKQDHVKLVHLLLELILTPNLESPLLCTWADLLTMLLKKPKTLTRDDLEIPWQPLYDLIKSVFKNKFGDLGMKIYSTHTLTGLETLMDYVRWYFPAESTAEMLEEWRPLLCPFDLSLSEGIQYLSVFLPTLLPVQDHHRGFKLWFEELLKIWLTINPGTTADEPFIKLFVRVAKDNVGYIDWNPHLPQLFTRILGSFQLPVGPKELRTNQIKAVMEARHSASLIVSTLGGQSTAQEHLNRLMQCLESFYHPSNLGRQTKKLLVFLKEISSKFILRLKKERFSTPRWYNTIPDQAKLTEQDVDAFVQCLIPAMKMAIFSKFGTMEAALTLHNLALVRPELVLPDLLNSTYTALETLTEPHQVLATLQCLTAISRELLGGGNGRYPEGKKHLFSLLTHALPGIDSNDFRKTLVCGLLISALVAMVPLVDCSSALGCEHLNMTEDEKELCSLTASFEDFILLYLDRCFALVENTRLEQVTMQDRQTSTVAKDMHESIMGAGISGSVHTILVQCSPRLFQLALDKLFRFATSQVFESEMASRVCADMCSSASKANPVETLRLFIPCCLKAINQILEEDPYQTEAEYPDHALIWNLQLLSQLLQFVGAAILPYQDDLLTCLKRCVHLKSKKGAKYAAEALNCILQSLTTMYPLDNRSVAGGFHRPPEEHLYVRDWAIPADEKDAGLEWHIPSLEELAMVDWILVECLAPEMETLRRFMGGEEMEREKLNQTLELVQNIIFGAASYLPMWEGPQVEGCPSSVVELKRKYYITFKLAKAPPEQFQRDKLAVFVHELTEYIMRTREDDTKSMFALVMMNKTLLLFHGVSKSEQDNKWRAFKYSKSIISNKLRGRKSQIRPLLITRVQLQHENRLVERTMSIQTDLHHLLLKDLLKMAVSEYAQVRVKAQGALSRLMDVYLYAGRKLLSHVLPYLRGDQEVSHEQFKGALHVLLIHSMMNVYIHDWGMLRLTLPAIVQADHSEKPSIQKLMTKLLADIHTRYEHFTLEFKVTERVESLAASLHPVAVSQEERDHGVARNQQSSERSIENYEGAVKTLVQLCEDGKLQWRYNQFAINLLAVLIRHDHPLPTEAVKLHTNNLVHDALTVRKIAVSAVSLILQQQKRKVLKVPVDVAREAGVSSLSTELPPGEKDENLWLCYDPERCPTTEEQWDQFKFVDKTHWGYYTYPKVLLTYAPYKEQPSLERTPEELSESEKVIYDAFSSEEFVEKLVTFFSLEEVKGRDKFDIHKFTLFKYLFRNFGITFLPKFQSHIEKHALDSQHESHQRFASEIISAMVSSSKGWSFAMVEEMRQFLEPLMAKVLDAVTPETISDWSTCMTEISANRDPRRLHWLFQLLMTNPINGENGSFKDASRLLLLQFLLAQQEWRVPPLLNRLVSYLQTHLAHSYKNVRERVGSVLSQLFAFDMPTLVTMKFNPRRSEFIEHALQKMPTIEQLPTLTEDEATLKLCKTCLVWLISSFDFQPQIFPLLSKLLPLVTVETEDETGLLVRRVCATVAHAELSPQAVSQALAALEEAIGTGLWKVRVMALQMLQVLIFNNFFLCVPHSQSVTDLLVSLCENSQMEVRELVVSSISGLIRCGYINCIEKLKAHFIEQSHCKLPAKPKAGPKPESGEGVGSDNGYEAALMRRHSGVLGLAALVEACPYSVPEWLPDILDEMALHLHDPASIQGTVKKTMSEFKRTHHDNWSEHKQKFTDDQLAVLADLLISPSYYA